MVEFHFVLGLVEVELVTIEYTSGSFAGGDFTDISPFSVLFWQNLGVVLIGVVSELDWSVD